MALYCTNCRTVASAGEATCGNCRNGFVSKMACGSCNKVVPTGQSYCPDGCDRRLARGGRAFEETELFPRDPRYPVAGGALPALAGGSLAKIYVPEAYQAGQHGAISDVQMAGRDAEILTKMNALVAVLYAVAEDMSIFVQKADSTRALIKGCRNLAADLQEEVEVRRGPGR